MKSKVDEEEEEEEDGEEGQKGKKFIEKLRRRAVFVVGHRSVVLLRQPSTPVHISFNPNNHNPSSRKLAASLWEFYQYHENDHHHKIPPPAKMHRHGKAAIKDTDHQKPVSPSSYDSSLEVTPGRRRRRRRRRNNLKTTTTTTTELLKVLNRIYTLEEQHSANISLIKSLKTELAHSQARIKELLKSQQTNRHDIDDFAKQLSKETKEQDRLENERKLRKRFESLNRKLARELEEAKSMLSKEKKSKKILERLCDEFAKGIKNYEWEFRSLKQKSDKKNWQDDEQEQDRMMVLSIAESWIDERIQNRDDGSKLEFEIEEFLKSKQKEHIQEEEEESEKKPKPRRSPASLQVKFEDQMASAMSKSREMDNVVGEMRRNHHRRLLSEARGIDEASCSYYPRRESPIRRWDSRNVTSDLGVKENTLKEKLREERRKSSRTKDSDVICCRKMEQSETLLSENIDRKL